MMIHPKKIKKILVKRELHKQHNISCWGLGSWDPAAKAYMMAYDKQPKDFATMYDEEAIL
jgi:hypothetical protein